ncbi:glycoside hydrolase family 97 protein [Flavobacterium rhizosphaerae]|uniref:Glycoside hydrolase family 97 protein n=1 Tax=Flavobacterium rhizosphaerae TaxID=3163298 RepID=A0ABW8YTS3_9FLAO
MKKKKYTQVLLFFIFFTVFTIYAQDKTHKLTSPGNINTIAFTLKNGLPTYTVNHNNDEVITPSSMGFVLKDEDLSKNFKVTDSKTSSFDETWTQVWGEKKNIRNHYNQMVVQLQTNDNRKRKLNIEFRAFDDGVAFRYVFPEQGIKDSLYIMDEVTAFNLKEDGQAWWIPGYEEQQMEYLFTKSSVSSLKVVHTPLTIENKNNIISFHEAGLDDFSAMMLSRISGTALKSELHPWADGIKVRDKGTFTSPWRTLQIGQKPSDLVESYLILNLNEPPAIPQQEYGHPFKYIGIWWGMHIGKYSFWEGKKQGATTKHAKEYIDFAAKEGINYLLIEGWNKGWTPDWYKNQVHIFSFTQNADNFNLEEVVRYGRSKGVEIIGYHETGSNINNYLTEIDEAFALYKRLGIRNIKIGQVGSLLNMKEYHQSQYGVRYYRYVLKKAAEYGLAVNFHEPIKDTGERRTYPNMMAREGARGMEYNAWSEGNPPNYETILPFTRMLSGPMDFTPGILDVEVKQGFPGRRVHTTAAKQLALYVVLYSPIQMLADLPENYDGQPAFKFLKDVPSDWEDTHVLNGVIGEYITTVRKDRNSADWYLGSITNEKARKLEVSLSFLETGAKYEAQIYTDAPGTDETHNPGDVALSSKVVTSEDTMIFNLPVSGGYAIRFKKTE